MEKINKFKLLIFTTITIVMGLTSCVKSDLDDCPTTAAYSLVYKYTLNPEYKDKFTDVDKLFIYVFDKKIGECIAMDTQTGPFPLEYKYSLSLFPGDYDIITWGYDWPDNDPAQKATTVVPDIVVGTFGVSGTGTKLSDARLILNQLSSTYASSTYCEVDDDIENTFYGEKEVNISDLYNLKTDTVYLKNLTNQIRIIFEDMTTSKLQKNVSAKIISKNGAYYFYNSNYNNPMYDVSYKGIEYSPYATFHTDSILENDPIVTNNIGQVGFADSVLVTDFSILRLFKSDDPFIVLQDAYLLIEWTDENGIKYGAGGTQPGLTLSLRDVLGAALIASGTTAYQADYDRQNRWEIKFKLRETYTTMTINVLGWNIHINNVEAGLPNWYK